MGSDSAPQQLTWYWACATFKAIDREGDRKKKHLWERTVFLLRSETPETARIKAHKLAKDKEHGYRSATNHDVYWELQEVERVEPLFDAEIADGTEVYWKLFECVR